MADPLRVRDIRFGCAVRSLRSERQRGELRSSLPFDVWSADAHEVFGLVRSGVDAEAHVAADSCGQS